jgi:hypothetical protein
MNSRRFGSLITLGLLLGTACPGIAHGPELDYQGGRVVVITPSVLADGTGIYEDEFAFGFTNLGWQSLPTAVGGGHLTIGSTIGLAVHDLAPNFKLASPQFLFFHNGTSFADPGSASLKILGTTALINKGGANFSDLPIGDVFGPDDFHDHLGVLLQSGSTGVYGMLISNTSTDPSVADSQPYYLLINNDLGPAGYNQALADLNATAIPEVSTACMLGSGLAVVGLARLGRRVFFRSRSTSFVQTA